MNACGGGVGNDTHQGEDREDRADDGDQLLRQLGDVQGDAKEGTYLLSEEEQCGDKRDPKAPWSPTPTLTICLSAR